MWQMFERQFQNEIYTFYTWFAHRWNRQERSFLESARIFMIAFNLEELWSIYYGTLMIWS